MTVIGQRIKHITKGIGQIIRQNGNIIDVRFEDKELSFKFPDDSYKNYFCFIDLSDKELEELLDDTSDDVDILTEEEKKELEKEEIICDESYNYQKTNFYTYIAGLEKEKEYVRMHGGKLCYVENGILVKEDGFTFTYSYEHDGNQYFPDDSSIRINAKEPFWARIVAADENIVIINSSIKLPPIIEFYTSSYIIVDNLSKHVKNVIKQIEETEKKTSIVAKLTKENKNQISYGQLLKGQDAAVEFSMSNQIEFVWGPPGTGKTETLAKIARTHIAEGEKILMLSNSNVAVDEAAYRVYKSRFLNEKIKPLSIIRYGYPKKEEVLKTPEIISYQIAINSNPRLAEEQKKLEEEKKSLKKDNARYAIIIERLKEIRKVYKDKEKHIVENADFVSTTVAKAVMDKTLYKRKYDTVIIDEASMLIVPQIIFCASLAKKHLIILGDFQQLPPIVLNSTKDKPSVLSKDIYDFVGIREAIDQKRNHKWLVMLNEQHRFHDDISRFVSRTMYSGLLETANHVKNDVSNIIQQEPFPNKAIVMADTSHLLTPFLKAPNGSYFSILSAFIAVANATQYPKDMSIGIITPYNAQARLLRAIVQDINKLKLQKENPYNITCATVHSFQGSEQQIVIYDACDCYINPFPTMLMTDNRNNISNRLFNVALTRTKGKFIALMNYSYMDDKIEPRNKVFRKLFKELHESNSVISLKELFPRNMEKPLIPKNRKSAMELLEKDFSDCSKSIEIYVAGKPTQSFFEIMELIKPKDGLILKLHIGSRECTDEVKKYFKEENIKCHAFNLNPMIIIDNKVVWYGEPLSLATFKLKVGEYTVMYRPILRLKGENTAKVIHYLIK